MLNLVLERGVADIRLLETGGPRPGECFIAAGVPWFATLFGRDAILASLFLLPVMPDLARSTLEVLARRQATVRDDWRDAEPGKILHELRTGEMARTGELPFTPVLRQRRRDPTVVAAARGDPRVDGRRCARRSPLAERPGRHRLAGRPGAARRVHPVRVPLCSGAPEPGLEGFPRFDPRPTWHRRRAPRRADRGPGVHGGGAAGHVRPRHAPGRARPGRPARDLRRGSCGRVETTFWRPDLDRYAMAIDGEGRAADALASNVAHGLWTGVLDPVRARPWSPAT